MFLIGEIRDPSLVKEMESFLAKSEIPYEIMVEKQKDHEVFIIYVLNEKDRPISFNHYRAILGLPKPYVIDPEWKKIKALPKGQITRTIIYFCAGLYLLRYLAPDTEKLFVNFFFISTGKQGLFTEILQGQFWRLITPIFLHFNFFHILFNMMWLNDLGNIIEVRFSQKTYLFFIAMAGISSNIGQYLIMGPHFGGMSGVVYALLGLIWMNKLFHPSIDIMLPKNDVYLMIGWFILCMTGLLGPIANMAHGIGLTSGMFCGIYLGVKNEKSYKISKVYLYLLLASSFTLLSFVSDFLRLDGKIFFGQ